MIRKYIKERFNAAGVSRIEIERAANRGPGDDPHPPGQGWSSDGEERKSRAVREGLERENRQADSKVNIVEDQSA